MVSELARSDFRPLAFELEFDCLTQSRPDAPQLQLRGKIYRVDGWAHDGKLYLRVMDYKTGSKSFSLEDVWYGMNLQMLLYLFALARGDGPFGENVVPAGVLYVPARDKLVSAQCRDDEQAQKKRSDALRRSGLLLSDAAVLEAMEHGGQPMYLPVKYDGDGAAAGAALASAEQLGALSRHIELLLSRMAGELRHGGIHMPILILGHTPREQVKNLIDLHITQAVSCAAKAEEYSAEAVRCGGTLKVHIKVDTGMSRLGYLCAGDMFDTGVEGICQACTAPGLEAEGIFTHFAVADEPDADSRAYTMAQFNLFRRVTAAVERRLGRPFAIRHCANSGAVAAYPETYLDMVRPGILLYGCTPAARELGLVPVMTLKTTISTIKTYGPGVDVSYGRLFTTPRTTRMGVVPYGYADGFFRALSDRCAMMTDYGPAPQRGRICMDMSMIDLTELPQVQVGDEVEVFGRRAGVDDLAALAGTIPYELTCAVSKRVPRVYLKNGEVVERELLLRL